MDRSDYPTRKIRLGEPDDDTIGNMTPAERMNMVWQLTLQAWAFKGGLEEDEPRLRRDVVRVIRGGR